MDHRLSLKNTRQYALSFQLTIYNFYMKSKSTIYLCPDWHENFDKTKILKSQYAQVCNWPTCICCFWFLQVVKVTKHISLFTITVDSRMTGANKSSTFTSILKDYP